MQHFDYYDERLNQFGHNYEDDLKYLLSAIDKHAPSIDKAVIKLAFEMCYQSHIGITRASGVAYYTHPLAVALIVIEELEIEDIDVIVVAILHNILRDSPNITIDMLHKEFGETTAVLIERLQKISSSRVRLSDDKDSNKKNHGVEALHRLFLMVISDVRLFVLQLCNRLHDIRTLQYLPHHSQVSIATETLQFYIPFAHRFGLTKIQAELETRAFYFYNPLQYKKILDFLKVKKKIFTEYIYVLIDNINSCLNDLKIEHSIKVLHKQEYELFLLMQSGEKMDEINDIFSLYIVLNDATKYTCSKVYEFLYTKLIENDFIDMMKQPTIDMDNSIFAEIYGTIGRTKIIIKTQAMENETGHAIIKKIISSNNDISTTVAHYSDEDLELWKNLMQNTIETKDPSDAEQFLWNTIKTNLYNERILVYDKNGERYSLPAGSTILDLAFAISQNTGLSAITCKIDGIIKDIFSEVKNGDKVEIITSPLSHPDSSWINHVITFRSIAYLTNYFKSEYRLSENKPKNVLANEFQQFQITCIYTSNMLEEIRRTIGLDNINRISLARNLYSAVILIQTIIPMSSIRNDIFINLIKINGVKSVKIRKIAC